MAKGKHAAALFEVIHAAKDRQDKSGVLRTPKWWFKNRPEAAGGPSNTDDDPSPEVDANDPTQRPVPAPGAARAQAAPHPSTAAASSLRTGTAPPSSALRQRSESWKSSSIARQISQRMSYGTAAIVVGSVIVIGSATYVIGRKMGSGPAPASAESIDRLKQGKPNADVLKVGAGAPLASGAGGTAPISSAVDPGNVGATSKSGDTTSAPQPPADPSAPVRRVVNLQYVVVQSYPKEADALAAVAALARSNVPCTIQKGFWPSRPDWFTVIGTNGFERTRDNPEYSAYIATITAVGKNFAAKSKFRQFEPLLVTWKDASR
jgi:hypothetical protein